MQEDKSQAASVERGESEPKVVFHYIKSNFFRSIHIDGAMGSKSPAGHLHVAIYSERRAIPRTTFHIVNEEGELQSDQTVTDGRDGYVRELEADLVMSPDVAIGLAEWIKTTVESSEDEVE